MSVLERLRNMLDVVGKLRLEIAAMNTTLDALYSWQRTCAQCGRFLERNDPQKEVTCACGWVWK